MPTRSVPDSPVLILHLEDDSADAELIRQTLTTADLPAVVTLARSRAEFASALEQTAFHVVLSDYSLPEFDGTAALALARELAPDVPFIIVSGALDEETAVRLVLAGATDYVLKNRLRRLGPAVHRALREARERQARRSAERALESRARQQAVIAELGLQALGGLPLPELMETLARQVAATLAIEHTKVLELQPDGQTLRVVAGAGWEPGIVGAASVSADRDGQAGYTLMAQLPVVAIDLPTETRFAGMPLLHEHHVRSSMTAVIPGRVRPFGILGAHTTQARAFTDDDAHFLQAAANVLAEAVASQQSEAQLNLQLQRLALLAEAEQTFGEAGPDYRAVLNAVTRRVTALIGGGCTLRLLSEDERWLPVAADWHRNPETLAFMRGLAAGPLPADDSSLASEVVRSGHSKLVPVLVQEEARRLVADAWLPYWERFGAHSLVAVPLRARGRVLGVMLATRDETAAPYTLDDQYLLRGLADRAALAIDNARLYEGAQQAWGAAELAAERTSRLQAVTALLAAALTPDQVGRIIVNEGTAVLGTSAATLQVITPDGQHLEVVNVSTRHATVRRQRRLMSLSDPMPSAEVIRTGAAVWAASHEEVIARYPSMARGRLLAGYEALAVLPMTVESRPIGTLAINFPQVRSFSAEEQAFMLTLAGFCAQAMERARLFAQVQEHNAALERRVSQRTEQLRALTARLESLREDERARIAREVHDELGGALTAIKMDLSRLARRPGSDVPEALAETIGLIDSTIQTVRRIATDLRPALLDDFGLVAAIEWQAQEFSRRTGIQCEVVLGVPSVDLDRAAGTALFRVLQEALTNVARHAAASRVIVTLEQRPGALVLCLADNGRGFAVEAPAQSPSLGLAGMRERVFSISGEIDVRSAPGAGTTVTVTIPFHD